MATCVIVGIGGDAAWSSGRGWRRWSIRRGRAAGGGEVIEAREELFDGRRGAGGSAGRSIEDDREAEGAGGGELGVGGGAAAVLGDDDLDARGGGGGRVSSASAKGPRAARMLAPGRASGARGLDAAEEVAVLRGGAEGGGLLAADGEEDAPRGWGRGPGRRRACRGRGSSGRRARASRAGGRGRGAGCRFGGRLAAALAEMRRAKGWVASMRMSTRFGLRASGRGLRRRRSRRCGRRPAAGPGSRVRPARERVTRASGRAARRAARCARLGGAAEDEECGGHAVI